MRREGVCAYESGPMTSGMMPSRLRIPGSIALLDIALISVLLIVFCARIWNLGIVFHDDAMWALWAHTPGSDPVSGLTRAQGRLWAFSAGNLILHTLTWQGTLYGEVLRVGSVVIFFVAFHIFVVVYCGRQIALLSASLFFSCLSLRWEGSVLTATPLLSWVHATLFVAAALFGRAYVVSGKTLFAVGAGFLLTLSLLTNEGVALLFLVLFGITLIGNVIAVGTVRSIVSEFTRPTRTRRLSLISLSFVGAYALLAVAWAWGGAQYAAHSLAPFNLYRTALVLAEFATSHSMLASFVKPYFVNYSDPAAGFIARMEYSPSSFLPMIWAPIPLMSGFAAAFIFFRAAWVRLSMSPQGSNSTHSELLAVSMGLSIAIVPIFPVALTTRYQQWYFDQGLTSYGQAALGYFGIALLLATAASMILRLIGRGWQTVVVVSLVTMIGILTAVSCRMNDAIALHMRPESGRWRVLGLTLETIEAARMDLAAIWAPRFKNGSWNAVLPSSYWSDYARARYKTAIRFLDDPPNSESQQRTAYLDYALADDEYSFFVVIGSLKSTSAGTAIVDKIAVAFEKSTRAYVDSYVLSFVDERGQWRRFLIKDLIARGDKSRVGVLENVAAVPGSLRVSQINTTPVEFAPTLPGTIRSEK
jgi:hypothetical protein